MFSLEINFLLDRQDVCQGKTANRLSTRQPSSSSSKLEYIRQVTRRLARIIQLLRTNWNKFVEREDPIKVLEQSILEMQEFLVQRRQKLSKASALLQRIQWQSTKDVQVASALQPEIEQQKNLVETLKHDVVDLENKISKTKLQKYLLELQTLETKAIKPLKTLKAFWLQYELLMSTEISIKQVEFLEMQLLEMQYPLSELRGVVAQIIAAQKRTQFQCNYAHSQGNEETAQLLLTTLKQLTASKDRLNQQLLTWETRLAELKMKIYILRIHLERAKSN